MSDLLLTCENFSGTLHPVFVVADIPLEVRIASALGRQASIDDCQVINQFLQEAHEYNQILECEGTDSLVLVRRPERALFLPDYHADDFTTPPELAGKPISAIREIFREHWSMKADPKTSREMTQRMFVVMDERTARDRTVVLCQDSVYGEDIVRSEPACICSTLGPLDTKLDSPSLLSGIDQGEEGPERDSESGLLIFRWVWHKTMFGDDLPDKFDDYVDCNGFSPEHPNFHSAENSL